MSQQKDIYRVPVLEAYSEPCLQRRWSYLLGLYGQGPENRRWQSFQSNNLITRENLRMKFVILFFRKSFEWKRFILRKKELNRLEKGCIGNKWINIWSLFKISPHDRRAFQEVTYDKCLKKLSENFENLPEPDLHSSVESVKSVCKIVFS